MTHFYSFKIAIFSEDYSFQLLNPGMFTVTMAPEETIEGELIFMPTEVNILSNLHQCISDA